MVWIKIARQTIPEAATLKGLIKMYTKYKIIPFCPYHFVPTILSTTILSVYHVVHTILFVYHFVHYHFVRSPIRQVIKCGFLIPLIFLGVGPKIEEYYSHYGANISTSYNINAEHTFVRCEINLVNTCIVHTVIQLPAFK